ncbi:hypothetical protein QBC46DRAFT_401781 [Diplogelasinospora grovesii]|uniref:DUF7730 domain-containing protein n=1 Tax=Diplogelasinospora grovesii TaxID=303347 RepID=A0AAN6MU77_9PEZI|nr:hypothetical protein QBC46DRAFT_401781 [Diplogelasinospora grovesii]
MASPSGRKDIAKRYCDLDLSDTEPSSTEGKENSLPRPRRQRGLPAPTTNKPEQEFTLLALPPEIRILIYDLLLVNRVKKPSRVVGNPHLIQMEVEMSIFQAPGLTIIEPAILRTCKQIYHEAIPILYSCNEFHIYAPEPLFPFMAQIGPTNIKLVRSLEIWVPYDAEISPWLILLDTLSKKATGLRFVVLAWGTDRGIIWPRGAAERGLGDNLLFVRALVRALARIQGLEKLNIKGFYAKHWPSYLREKMSAQVRADAGHCCVKIRYDDDPEAERRKRELIERELLCFKDYQKGTDDLIP